VARYLGGAGLLIEDPSVSDVDVVVVIGEDWRSVTGKDKEVDAPSTTSTTAAKSSGKAPAGGVKGGPPAASSVPAC